MHIHPFTGRVSSWSDVIFTALRNLLKDAVYGILSNVIMANSNNKLSPGPFERPLAEAADLAPESEVERCMDCSHYEECLGLAAALNWDDFSCAGCSQEVNRSLVWRAHVSAKRDAIVSALCALPRLIAVKQS